MKQQVCIEAKVLFQKENYNLIEIDTAGYNSIYLIINEIGEVISGELGNKENILELWEKI